MTSKRHLFSEIGEHLLKDEKPSAYLNRVSDSPMFFEYPFSMLKDLKKTEQSPKYHPEGSAWNHTMLVVDAAAGVKDKSRDKRVFLWAALLHDIGKAPATRKRNGRIISYDHDKIGAKMAMDFLGEFTNDFDFISRVSLLVRWHMQVLFVVNGLPFSDIGTMRDQVELSEVALLGLCDRMGRDGADEAHEKEAVRTFLQKCGGNRTKINHLYL